VCKYLELRGSVSRLCRLCVICK